MHYRLLNLTKTDSTEYVLELEEFPAMWSRLFYSQFPHKLTLYGTTDGHWETKPYAYTLSSDLLEFANKAVKDYPNGYSICVRV